MGGSRATGRQGSGENFFDHRPYLPGDDVRHINWSLYARLGRPLVRQFESDTHVSFRVLVDASASMAVGAPSKWDMAVRLAAALCFVADGERDRTQILIARAAVDASTVSLHLRPEQQCEALANVAPHGHTSLAAVAAAPEVRKAGRTQLVWISDFLDAAGVDEACARVRGAGGSPLFVQVESVLDVTPEHVLPSDGVVRVRDSETKADLDVRVTPAALRAYQQQRHIYNDALSRLCRARGIRLLRVRSDAAFPAAALQLLRHLGL